jgi:hypothetical protein
VEWEGKTERVGILGFRREEKPEIDDAINESNVHRGHKETTKDKEDGGLLLSSSHFHVIVYSYHYTPNSARRPM